MPRCSCSSGAAEPPVTWQESRAELRYQQLTDVISRLDVQMDRLVAETAPEPSVDGERHYAAGGALRGLG
jgi:hypothetical protein